MMKIFPALCSRNKFETAALALLFALAATSCSSSTEDTSHRKQSSPGSSEANQANQDAKQGSKNEETEKKQDSGSSEGDGQSKDENSANQTGETKEDKVTQIDNQLPINKNPAPLKVAFDKKKYYTDVIYPAFTNSCQSCHVGPRVETSTRGPLTIFNYDTMLAMLENGSSSKTNKLYRKVRSLDSHTGGDRCSTGPEQSPCKELIGWYTGIHGADSETPVVDASSIGAITQGTYTGSIYGYAFDPGSLTTAVTVEFFKNGDNLTGTSLGTAVANALGFDGNQEGNHAFKFEIPTSMIDAGKSMKISAYITINAKPMMVGTTPLDLVAYIPRANDYYESNVKTAFAAACDGCHKGRNYTGLYSYLISPQPHLSGTANTNVLYKYASGVNHSGGNRCGGGNDPCAAIQQWWQREFGPAQ